MIGCSPGKVLPEDGLEELQADPEDLKSTDEVQNKSGWTCLSFSGVVEAGDKEVAEQDLVTRRWEWMKPPSHPEGNSQGDHLLGEGLHLIHESCGWKKGVSSCWLHSLTQTGVQVHDRRQGP